jgi:hypothetical protein
MIDSKMKNIVSGLTARSAIIYFFLSGLFLGAIILKLPFIAIAFPLGITIIIAFANKPLGALAVLILLLPISRTVLLSSPIMMKGTEPIILIATMVIFFALINIKYSVVIPRYALIFILIILIVHTIAAFRSIPNLDAINWHQAMERGKETLSISEHILKTLVRPLFYFLPIIVVIKYVKNTNNLEFIIKTLNLSVLICSISILFIYFLKVPGRNALEANQNYLYYLGLHRNALANYIILGLPFFIARCFLKKNIFNLLSICLCIIAGGFLFSRTAYVNIILAFMLYFFISKRKKFLPVLVAMIAFFLIFIVSSVIIERASKGLDTMDKNEISAGRIEETWLPLINEYFNEPNKLLFGNGRFATASSESAAKGQIPAGRFHPHNMYLELILDSGIILFSLTISFFTFIMLQIFNSLKVIREKKTREYQYAVFVSLTSYFLAGVTGRTLFPSGNNAFIWIILGLGIAIISMNRQFKEDTEKKIYESSHFTS